MVMVEVMFDVPASDAEATLETQIPELTEPKQLDQYREQIDLIARKLYELDPSGSKDSQYCDVRLALTLANGLVASLGSTLRFATDFKRERPDLLTDEVTGLQRVLINTLHVARKRLKMSPPAVQ